MRIKRHKAVRKTLKFFHVNFGFREPYKVLVDGNFIHAVLATGNGDVEATLSKLLMGNVRAFTTRYTLHELHGMGKEYRATLEGARRLERHKCSYEGVTTAAECIKREVGEKNESHFFVATQDKDLQKYLSKSSVVPIIFKTVNGVSLQKPGSNLQNFVNRASEAKMGIQDYERGTRVMRELAGGEEAQQDQLVRKKKKKAKGPNPLSVRKKSAKGPERRRHNQEAQPAAQAEKPKRRRVRGKARAGAAGGGNDVE
ncbi:rRNA-processing protein Utp23 [Chloropicon primus]|uniref:rRNA-processing protein Utp23 n=2 Tax=Chloropicon primus TaxID=1764295 RepID=A0A5B8MRB8_9CHLO|nr:rRNA-processing protein Utp23 [Chloropicon primus]|eukprot:QDZ21792.1 rRNA-processing protein Utp23 [Chloropicon primus]